MLNYTVRSPNDSIIIIGGLAGGSIENDEGAKTMSKLLPDKVTIGAYEVKVYYTEHLLRDHGCVGRYMPCEKKIEVDSEMCEDMQWGTFYHELIEAMTEIYAIDALANDHGAINVLSEVLHQVMRENRGAILP